MKEGTTYVGMDVHKRTIAVSVRFPGGGFDERTIPHEARSVNRLVRKWKREAPGVILCAYEAGPCGYGLQRALQEQGLACQVIAPSGIRKGPQAPHGCRCRSAASHQVSADRRLVGKPSIISEAVCR